MRLIRSIPCLFLLHIILIHTVLSQENRIPLIIVITDDQPHDRVALKGPVQADSLTIRKELSRVLDDYFREGYLAASIDSFSIGKDSVTACCHKGPLFRWVRVSFDSIEVSLLRKAKVNPRYYHNRPMDPQQFVKDQGNLVSVLENEGYPFASARLSRVRFTDQTAEGTMILDKGPVIRIDSIIIKGNAKISGPFIHKQTGIDKDDLYRENRISAISDRIKETTFLREIKPFEIEFREGKADIYTYLEKNRASQFSGIIGIIPNNGKTGKLLLTGEVNLNLVNLFSRGIFFGMEWKKLEPLTQELRVRGSYPYILNSSVGIGLDMFLLKQDTTFFRLEPEAELMYFFNGNNYLKIFFMGQSSSLLSSSGMENVGVLPVHADYTTSLYGAGIKFTRLDYIYNPMKGIAATGDISVGSKKIKKNPDINEDVYGDIDLSTTKFISTTELYAYLPAGRRFVIHFRNLNGIMVNENLFENELFRIGGIRNLRGVDENSITASTYFLGSMEIRFLFEEQSNLFLFIDGGYYEKKISTGITTDTPLGFGAGMNLQTRAGIFTISYALGRQFDNPVNIGDAKVHIGYIQRF